MLTSRKNVIMLFKSEEQVKTLLLGTVICMICKPKRYVETLTPRMCEVSLFGDKVLSRCSKFQMRSIGEPKSIMIYVSHRKKKENLEIDADIHRGSG